MLVQEASDDIGQPEPVLERFGAETVAIPDFFSLKGWRTVRTRLLDESILPYCIFVQKHCPRIFLAFGTLTVTPRGHYAAPVPFLY